MSKTKRILIPIGAGLVGIIILAGLYFGIMSWAEGFKTAWGLFWYDRRIIIPIMLGFGIQAALYAVLKFRLFEPASTTGPSGTLMGAGGITSSVAMLACCVHHVTDVLPIQGLTAAATFLGRYRLVFMRASLGMTIAGIIVMLIVLFKEHRKSMNITRPIQTAETI
jgi:hypothetical protein